MKPMDVNKTVMKIFESEELGEKDREEARNGAGKDLVELDFSFIQYKAEMPAHVLIGKIKSSLMKFERDVKYMAKNPNQAVTLYSEGSAGSHAPESNTFEFEVIDDKKSEAVKEDLDNTMRGTPFEEDLGNIVDAVRSMRGTMLGHDGVKFKSTNPSKYLIVKHIYDQLIKTVDHIDKLI